MKQFEHFGGASEAGEQEYLSSSLTWLVCAEDMLQALVG